MPAPLYVVYRSVPSLDAAAIAQRLGGGATAAGSRTDVTVQHAGQKLRVVAIDAPVAAAEVARCLPVAHLQPGMKEQIAAHKAHVAMIHDQDFPGMDGVIAMYQLAGALGGEMIGVINPISCMCLTAPILADTLAPDHVALARKTPAAATLGLWLGFVKLFKEDGSTWVTTTGAPLIHLPNLATLARTRAEIDPAFDMLVGLLDYLFSGLGGGKKMILPGDTIDFGDIPLLARAPYEHVEQIGERTVVLERRLPASA